MKTYILLPWGQSLSLATPKSLTSSFFSLQFPYRFQKNGFSAWNQRREQNGTSSYLLFSSSQWTSSDCLPHQSGHSAVQDSLWNLFSHHQVTDPHWHLYTSSFAAVQDAVCLAGRLFGMASFSFIPTALILLSL